MLKELYAAEEDNIIAEVNKMVDCYKGEAERLGINIKDCYNAAEDQILNMPVEFIKNLTTCATDEYDGAMELVDSALGIYDSIIDELKEFPDKIVSCTEQGWWSAPTCVIGVITDIAGLALKIPTTYAPKLVELSAKLGVYISGMTVRVQICGSFKTTILAANAMSISSNFIGCVKNKFPEPVNCLNA